MTDDVQRRKFSCCHWRFTWTINRFESYLLWLWNSEWSICVSSNGLWSIRRFVGESFGCGLMMNKSSSLIIVDERIDWIESTSDRWCSSSFVCCWFSFCRSNCSPVKVKWQSTFSVEDVIIEIFNEPSSSIKLIFVCAWLTLSLLLIEFSMSVKSICRIEEENLLWSKPFDDFE